MDEYYTVRSKSAGLGTSSSGNAGEQLSALEFRASSFKVRVPGQVQVSLVSKYRDKNQEGPIPQQCNYGRSAIELEGTYSSR
jgi:hypothetical protein